MQTALRYMLLNDMLLAYVDGVEGDNKAYIDDNEKGDPMNDIYKVERDLRLAYMDMGIFIDNQMKPSFAKSRQVDVVVNSGWRVAGAAAALLRALKVDWSKSLTEDAHAQASVRPGSSARTAAVRPPGSVRERAPAALALSGKSCSPGVRSHSRPNANATRPRR